MSNDMAPKKTRLKGSAAKKTCVGCNAEKDRFRDFRPRWSRCPRHRIKSKRSDPNCGECQKLVNSNIRQPRCVECDAQRATKKGKKTTTTPVAAPTPAPTPEPVAVAPVVTAQAAPAPEATPVQVPSPVAPTPTATAPAPEPVAVAAPAQAAPVATATAPKTTKKKKPGLAKLADLAKLLDSEPGSDDSPH